jgi:hypothetical protein
MNVKISGFAVSLGALMALGAAAPASAQTTTRIVLTTANGDCTATTADPQGLHLAPGSTDLVASGVTLSGTACGGSGVTAPTSVTLSAPSTATIGVAFAIAWTSQGGAPATCTGTATKDGVDAGAVPGWTTTTSVVSPRTVTASAAGAYVFKLTCANSAGNAFGTANVTVTTQPGSGDDCPATILSNPAIPTSQVLTRLTTSNISYGIYPAARPGVDITKWENVWGHGSVTDNVTAWPGPLSSSPVIRDFGRNTYLAAKFHTPATFTPTIPFGQYQHAPNPPGPSVTASISTTCANFAPGPQAYCTISAWPDDTSSGLQWTSPASPNGSYCKLQPNTDYYLNMKFTDPTSTESCTDATCAVYLQQTHN